MDEDIVINDIYNQKDSVSWQRFLPALGSLLSQGLLSDSQVQWCQPETPASYWNIKIVLWALFPKQMMNLDWRVFIFPYIHAYLNMWKLQRLVFFILRCWWTSLDLHNCSSLMFWWAEHWFLYTRKDQKTNLGSMAINLAHCTKSAVN